MTIYVYDIELMFQLGSTINNITTIEKEERLAAGAASPIGDVDSSFLIQSSFIYNTTPSKKETKKEKLSFMRKVAQINLEKFGNMDLNDIGAITKSLLKRAKKKKTIYQAGIVQLQEKSFERRYLKSGIHDLQLLMLNRKFA